MPKPASSQASDVGGHGGTGVGFSQSGTEHREDAATCSICSIVNKVSPQSGVLVVKSPVQVPYELLASARIKFMSSLSQSLRPAFLSVMMDLQVSQPSVSNFQVVAVVPETL